MAKKRMDRRRSRAPKQLIPLPPGKAGAEWAARSLRAAYRAGCRAVVVEDLSPRPNAGLLKVVRSASSMGYSSVDLAVCACPDAACLRKAAKAGLSKVEIDPASRTGRTVLPSAGDLAALGRAVTVPDVTVSLYLAVSKGFSKVLDKLIVLLGENGARVREWKLTRRNGAPQMELVLGEGPRVR